jgi:hypothetical protein
MLVKRMKEKSLLIQILIIQWISNQMLISAERPDELIRKRTDSIGRPKAATKKMKDCYNDMNFTFEGLTCHTVRVRESKRQKYCQMEAFSNACPISCGVCCVDDQTFQLNSRANINKNCAWIGAKTKRKKALCDEFRNKKNVRDACPKTCDYCTEYVPINFEPSPAPGETDPTKEKPCLNSRAFRHENDDMKTCSWIADNDRTSLCSTSMEVREQCPQTCGICCQDDPDFKFKETQLLLVEKKVDCKWIAKFKTRLSTYCNESFFGIAVKDACPKSCGKCLTHIALDIDDSMK